MILRLFPFLLLVRASCRWEWVQRTGQIVLTGENGTDRRKPKFSEQNLSHCHFVQYKSNMDSPRKCSVGPANNGLSQCIICSLPKCFFALARASQGTQSVVAMESYVWQYMPWKPDCSSLSHAMVLYKVQRVFKSISREIENKCVLWGWDYPTISVSNMFRPICTITKIRSICKSVLHHIFQTCINSLRKFTEASWMFLWI
jgi:hypothetical protein